MIRHVQPSTGDDDLELDRKVLNHAISFLCSSYSKGAQDPRRYGWTRRLEQSETERERSQKQCLRFREPLSKQYLLHIYERLEDGIMFSKDPLTSKIILDKNWTRNEAFMNENLDQLILRR